MMKTTITEPDQQQKNTETNKQKPVMKKRLNFSSISVQTFPLAMIPNHFDNFIYFGIAVNEFLFFMSKIVELQQEYSDIKQTNKHEKKKKQGRQSTNAHQFLTVHTIFGFEI